MENISTNYIKSVVKQLDYYKSVAEKAIAQINDDQLHYQFNEESNSIAIIIKHLSGNNLSRWIDFLNSDGEKPWRDRDSEFVDSNEDRDALLELWAQGWTALFDALNAVTEADLLRIIYIRTEPHTVIEAINRSLAHITYHAGQIVYLARMMAGSNWTSLTVPKGKSAEFNAAKFGQQR